MKHQKLRIAWSMVWEIVALLLIALWVRSYLSAGSYAFERFPEWWICVFNDHGRLGWMRA